MFTTPPEKSVKIIATGTGIAPFKAIIEDQLEKKNNTSQPIHLIFGVRHIKDIFYKEIFENLSEKHENFTFDLTLSRPEDPSWTGHSGRVTKLVEALNTDPQKNEVYICGLTAMIDSITEILKSKSIP
ncbi:MAG: hypothetical protein COV50_07880, partial [Flavobacteriales bacterium CG11_big_fil_rev_8_21_14_0_20_35_7]